MENIDPRTNPIPQDGADELTRLLAENAKMKELIGKLTALAKMGESTKKSNEDLQKTVNFYRQMRAKAKMEEDLKRIQKMDPSVRSLDELGGDYFSLIKNGIDGAAAFLAIRGMKDLDKPKTPPVIGALNTKAVNDREFFTSSELDSLTEKDLDDPRILNKAIKSLSRL